MAWYSNSSSWDWNAEGVIVSSHASGIDHCNKPAVNDWPSDTEFCPIKRDGPITHTSRGLYSSEVRTGIISQGVHVDVKEHGGLLTNRVVTPAMADMLVFDGGEVGYGNIVPMGQGKVPIVTTCIGNGAFIRCSDHGNGSLESIVRKGLPENQGSASRRDTQRLKPENQYSSFAQDKQCEGVKSKGKGLHVSPTKRLTDRHIKRTYNGDRTSVTNEQRSSPGMGSAGSGDSLTGLQLGKRTYSQDVTTPATAKAIPKTSSVSKRARTGVTASQIPRCQVEGCKVDLTSAKDYHRRHKVCEPHSKAGKVVVASLEQRFCQQCSRFHVLTEFDEAKRSCRRRLAGHNKRRRKPQPDPLELQARLRSSLEDWSFLHQPRYPRLPLWQDAGDSRSSALWPRKVMHCEDQPTFDHHSLQTFGTDVYMKGLSPSLTRDKFPLLLLHSPKTMMPMDTCDTRVHHQYIPGLVRGPVSNGLTLASSPMGAGVFTGLQTTPVTEVTRVSDSGCALSLLSLHMQCTQAPDMVSLDLSGLANTTVNHDQHVQEGAVTSQQVLLQGRHQYCDDFSTTLSMAPNLHLPSTADVHDGSHVMVSDKDFYECSFINNLNRQNGYEGSHSMVVNMQGHETTGQVKQTQDLMHMASFQVPNSPSQRSSMVFNLESSTLGDSHFSHESSFLKF